MLELVTVCLEIGWWERVWIVIKSVERKTSKLQQNWNVFHKEWKFFKERIIPLSSRTPVPSWTNPSDDPEVLDVPIYDHIDKSLATANIYKLLEADIKTKAWINLYGNHSSTLLYVFHR